MTRYFHSDSHQGRGAPNSSRLYPPEHHGNTFGHFLEFEKIPTFQCIRLDDMEIPSERYSVLDKKSDFLFRHRYRKIAAYVWMSGLHRLDAILDKARHAKDLQPFGRQSSLSGRSVLIMEIACNRSATVRTLGQHHPDAALFKK
jgi:hypothetical protein